MRVLYFALARTATGVAEETWNPDGPLTPEMFWEKAIQRHPGLASLRPFTRLARNAAYLLPEELIQPDDEIALIPPVSGG